MVFYRLAMSYKKPGPRLFLAITGVSSVVAFALGWRAFSG